MLVATIAFHLKILRGKIDIDWLRDPDTNLRQTQILWSSLRKGSYAVMRDGRSFHPTAIRPSFLHERQMLVAVPLYLQHALRYTAQNHRVFQRWLRCR